ncbi:hypothetical protein [Halovenus salina]|uniref:CDP-Glycerol:Poly(Glycerophosphate) glycerophosphotransferase n=1 Tax=Halovenus salina TaxID=1510225 RepID=A0ABD5W0I5_9EURY|nr:hypothetical protein [Halovenus salina]
MATTDIQYSDVSEFLFEIETTLDLCGWEIDGLRVWDYVRAPLQRKLFAELNATGESDSSVEEGLLTYLQGGYLWGRNILLGNPFFEDCAVLSYGTGRRKKLEDGTWWDIYFDPFYTRTEFDYLHVEQHFQNGHKTPARTEDLAYNDFIHYSGTIAHKLGLFDLNYSHEDRDTIDNIKRHTKDRFGRGVEVEPLIERKIRESKARKPLYDKLLERTDPEIAMMTTSYGRESFIRACKDQGVPVAELQHGAIDPYHPGYSFPDDSTKSIFPDYLLVWGEFWKQNIEFPIPDENIIITGYPYLENQVKRYSSNEEREQIIVISQPKAGKSLSKFAIELDGDDRIKSRIIYKLHPKEYEDWDERYPWLLESDLKIIESDVPSLYQLLAQSKTLIGVSSTVIYEGFNFGLETFLLDVPGIEMMEWIFDLDNIYVVGSTDELVERRAKGNRPVNTTRFFADSPVENLRETIIEITNGCITTSYS